MLNNVSLMGRLTATPELKQTTTGKYYTKFCLANSQKGSNGEDNTEFIDVVTWVKTAEFICKWFKKGDMIAITGRITTRNYETTDGHKVKAVEVLALTADFCGGKKEDQTTPVTPAPPVIETSDNSQLPFSLTDV